MGFHRPGGVHANMCNAQAGPSELTVPGGFAFPGPSGGNGSAMFLQSFAGCLFWFQRSWLKRVMWGRM